MFVWSLCDVCVKFVWGLLTTMSFLFDTCPTLPSSSLWTDSRAQYLTSITMPIGSSPPLSSLLFFSCTNLSIRSFKPPMLQLYLSSTPPACILKILYFPKLFFLRGHDVIRDRISSSSNRCRWRFLIRSCNFLTSLMMHMSSSLSSSTLHLGYLHYSWLSAWRMILLIYD